MESPENPAQNSATTSLGLWSISADMFFNPRHLQMCASHLFVDPARKHDPHGHYGAPGCVGVNSSSRSQG